MRKLLNIILSVICIIIIILSLAFIFIEGRLIFSLDWIIYDNKFNGLLRYSLRLILACLAIVICIFEMINIRRSNKDISDYLLFSDGGLVVASIVLLINTTNYINIICIALSSILFLTKIGLYKIQE
jgi:hypothetical protein